MSDAVVLQQCRDLSGIVRESVEAAARLSELLL
jgi:hypothetical protein